MTVDIVKTYRDFCRKRATSGGRRPGLHVSDLVPECIRTSYYRMNDSVIREFDNDSIDNFYYGTAIHDSFDGMYPIMEYKMCVNPFMEFTEYDMNDIEREMHDHPYQWVSGAADAIVNNEVILDFKTCTKLPGKNHESYMRQINCYAYMYYLHTGIEIKKGANLFLEKSSAFHNIRLFEFKLQPLEYTRKYMCEVMDKIGEEEPPERTTTPLCTTCTYKDVCDPHGYYDYIQKKMIY